MQFNTDLFYVDSRPQFGSFAQSSNSEWQLWFSEKNLNYKNPAVIEHRFPVKPTKRQVRKLRRAFRKEYQNSLAEFFAKEGSAAMYW